MDSRVGSGGLPPGRCGQPRAIGRALRSLVGVVMTLVLSACGTTYLTQSPTPTPIATRTPVVPVIGEDLHADWPGDVVIAVPPGAGADAVTTGFQRWGAVEQQNLIQAWKHVVWIHPYRPADSADLLAALAAGKVNIAVLDAADVAAALNQGMAIVPRAQEAALNPPGSDSPEGPHGTIPGWITVGDRLCSEAPTVSGDVDYCNGASDSAPQQGAAALAGLDPARIVLGDHASFIDFLVPGDQLLAAGVDPRSSQPALPDPAARLTALCTGQADVTVAPLPLGDLPAACTGKMLTVFATAPAVPGQAVVTAALPEEMAAQIAGDLAAESGCEVVLQNTACPPFWVPIWGSVLMGGAQVSYQPLAEALADLGS